jgi:hypothetical protein
MKEIKDLDKWLYNEHSINYACCNYEEEEDLKKVEYKSNDIVEWYYDYKIKLRGNNVINLIKVIEEDITTNDYKIRIYES